MAKRLCTGCGEKAAPRRSECYRCLYLRRSSKSDTAVVTVTHTSTSTESVKGGDGVTTIHRTIYKDTEQIAPELQKASPVIVRITVNQPGAKKVQKVGESLVALPDVHIGFRQTRNGLEPLHDIAAVDAAMSLVHYLKPTYVVWLGDFLDLPAFSKYPQEPGLVNMTQVAINEGHTVLASFVKAAPSAQHLLFEGNHDARILKTLAARAQEASNLSVANGTYPALSVPNLLRTDELGIEYLDGYPARTLRINGLELLHGYRAVSGSTAAKVAKDALCPTIFGHVHRRELHTAARADSSEVWAACPGTLSRTDGAVPSTMSAVSTLTGESITRYADWQQGVAVVEWVDGRPILELAPIYSGALVYRGRTFGSGN